ncbi:MAG: hypothetical protein GF310_10505 [candidate division Zixibacteria bacterium]|nr:hypothetical protein [candidate division Zixibacteria bacterium]
MNNDYIGETAGKIWQVLEKGESTPRKLATATKSKSDRVYMALGWLAREGKVNFNPTKSSFKVSINK